MKLERLKLTNFRGFREFEISFDPSFTVLLGGNMAGKTAVLDAAAIGLSIMIGDRSPFEIEAEDVHRVVVTSGGIPELQQRSPVHVEIELDEPLFPLNLRRFEASNEGAAPSPITVYEFIQWPIERELPVLARYGVRRHWDNAQSPDFPKGIGTRYDGYTSCFQAGASYTMLAGWMRKQTLVQLQRGGGYIQPQLAAIEAAVRSCLSRTRAISRFWFDVQYDELRLTLEEGGIQSFAMLSEGYRNMIAMVADIARRAAVLNPQFGTDAHLRTEGIVMVDELDLHLHPAWQRRIVDDLRRTFPKIQFIVTTHSPQIVASVARQQIRVLDQNKLVAEQPHVQGRDANEILEDVFGVPKRPEAVQSEIDALYREIEEENYAVARNLLAALQERLGPEDAAMIRAKWLLDTEDPPPSTDPSLSP